MFMFFTWAIKSNQSFSFVVVFFFFFYNLCPIVVHDLKVVSKSFYDFIKKKIRLSR